MIIIDPRVTQDNLDAHKAHLTREIMHWLTKKPGHTDYAKLNTLGQALAALEKIILAPGDANEP